MNTTNHSALKLPAAREALPSARTCGECARYSSSTTLLGSYMTRPLHNYFERQLWTFWGTHPGEVNGPLWRVNPELLEAVRPSFQDLESKLVDGSKSSYQRAKRGYAKVSCLCSLLWLGWFMYSFLCSWQKNEPLHGHRWILGPSPTSF